MSERVWGAMRRARRAGWLPRVTLGLARGRQRDWWWQRREAAGEAQRASGDEDLRFEVALRFELTRLAYAPEEAGLLAREQALRAERETLVRRLVDLYFERRRLLMEVELFGVRRPEAFARIEAIEAWFRWLSGGAIRMHAGGRAPADHGPGEGEVDSPLRLGARGAGHLVGGPSVRRGMVGRRTRRDVRASEPVSGSSEQQGDGAAARREPR